MMDPLFAPLTYDELYPGPARLAQVPDARPPATAATAATRPSGQAVEDTSARYFDRVGLLHATLRTAVVDLGPIATGPGGSLWRYKDGVWLDDGANEVRRRVALLLGERHRKSHGDGIVADLEAQEPFITDEQPTEWINCRNGLLDWRTGKLHPHDPAVPSTYQLRVDWTPHATCPAVDDWMATVVDDDTVPLLWEVMGTAIYPDQPFHRAVLLLGPGRNGKGTFLRLVGKVIGRRHVAAVTVQQLGGEDRFAAAELFGKVANIAGDLDARSIGRTDTFKMATGGDLISVQRKFGQPFTFTNRATFLFSANEAPATVDHTDGFFSRWVVVPFTKLALPPGSEDPSIETAMHQELDGVLVQAVNGLRRALTNGRYTIPTTVTTATAAYREAADPMRRFMEDCINVTGDRDDKEPRSTVYTTYKDWCAENGHRPLGANKFYGRLKVMDDRIDHDRKIAGVRYVTGIEVLKWR